MSELEYPVFDEVIYRALDSELTPIVTHRNAEGAIYAFHSPLENGPVRCALCETGTRVYL